MTMREDENAAEVLGHVLSELELTQANLPGATAADYAADVVDRLGRAYGVRTHDDDTPRVTIDAMHRETAVDACRDRAEQVRELAAEVGDPELVKAADEYDAAADALSRA